MMGMEQIDQRIACNLEAMKRFTATPKNGCTRLPFTQVTMEAALYLKNLMEEAGMETHADEAGNLFGYLRGMDSTLPCVMMGSHYDSVLHGGDYDGIAGVIGAIEVARNLRDSGNKFRRDFVVAAFNDEEGMRFGTGYFGSGAMLGTRTTEYCKKYKDIDGITIYDAMRNAGMDPENIASAKWPDHSIHCFLEMHIEQGPILDKEKIDLGLVDCIVGIQRYIVKIKGRADHAGTTPMAMRLDAVDAATKVISQIADWAKSTNDGSVATVGLIKAIPGGMNIVAEECEFTVDIRSRHQKNLNVISDKLKQALQKETLEMGGSFQICQKLDIKPANLCRHMLKILEKACQKYQFSYRYMISGAGHDALEISQFIPTVMIFVPSKDGRSHCPVEFTENHYFTKAVLTMIELAKIKLEEEILDTTSTMNVI